MFVPQVVILASLNDAHCLAVEWGLKKLGVSCYTWLPGDLPDATTASIRLGGDGADAEILVAHDGQVVDLGRAGVVWNRRRSSPQAPASAHPFDKSAIEAECLEHVRNILAVLSARVTTINSAGSQFTAGRKAVQIEVARKVGFTVPPTIFSNDYEQIGLFLESNAPAVAKVTQPHLWLQGGKQLAPYTFEIQSLDDVERHQVEFCPLIVQKKVARKSEVRAVLFGEDIFAVRTVLGRDGDHVDGRLVSKWKRFADAARVEMPSRVAHLCRSYMEKFDLAYGAFDFLITEDETWVFLECNESGQFLYLEQVLPELNMLDSFCRWLAGLAGAEISSRSDTVNMAGFGKEGVWMNAVREGSGHKRNFTSLQPTFEDADTEGLAGKRIGKVAGVTA